MADENGNLWERIKNGTKDALTLDVTTVEADITLEVGAGANTKKTLDDLFALLSTSIQKDSTAKVIAHTHVELDKDTVLVVGENANPKLFEHHQQAVKDAIEARTAMVRVATGLFGLKPSS